VLKRIHVNRHIVRSNSKNNLNEPVLTVKTSKSNNLAHKVEILGDTGEVVATVIYRPEKPMDCGATVWIETKNEIRLT
jgi:hypothetical protein